jgi:hypothetical protein
MRIVFGWNSFLLGRFSPIDLGIYQIEAAGYNFELRQRYFHIFFIPFFSLGKMWVIRKEGRLLAVPPELKLQIEASAIRRKTPWYTFVGLLLTAVISLGFFISNLNESRKYHESVIAGFNKGTAVLEEKLRHLTTQDIITAQEIDEQGQDNILYLKVEDINGDSILITPVESKSTVLLDIEDEYYRYVNSTPSVKISYKQLASTYPKVFDSSQTTAYRNMAKDLLGDGKKYVIRDVVRHFRPKVIDGYTGSYESDISLRFYSGGRAAVIADVKTLEGTIDWSQNISKPIPENRSSGDGPPFFLFGKNYRPGEAYKFVITLKDTMAQTVKYEVEGQDSYRTVREL